MEEDTDVEDAPANPYWTPPHPFRAWCERHAEVILIVGISLITLFVASRM